MPSEENTHPQHSHTHSPAHKQLFKFFSQNMLLLFLPPKKLLSLTFISKAAQFISTFCCESIVLCSFPFSISARSSTMQWNSLPILNQINRNEISSSRRDEIHEMKYLEVSRLQIKRALDFIYCTKRRTFWSSTSVLRKHMLQLEI